MRKPIDSFVVSSAINGDIRYVRSFFKWNVAAKGMDQSSDYLTRMWRNAIRRTVNNHSAADALVPHRGVRSILVLGLGAGSCIGALRRTYRGANITAVEWDPAMVEVADRIRNFTSKDRPRIVQGDVRDVLPSLDETFDVILIDLFDGPIVSSALKEAAMIEALRDHLKPDGVLLFNAFREPELFASFDRVLSRQAVWRYHWNWLGLYRRFGRGTIGDPLTEGYQPARTSDPYMERETNSGVFDQERVGQPGVPGMRWRHGPLRFEGYLGDHEPKIESGSTRMVIWQPIGRRDAPPGWRRSWLPASPQLTGFAEIVDPKTYWNDWSSQAKRHRAKWMKAPLFDIVGVTLDEFVASYGHRRVGSWLVRLTIQLIKNKVKRHGERVYFFGARDRSTGKLRAGLAVVDVPELHQSIHLASFINNDVRRTSVGVALIDAWFMRCISLGIRFLDFDLFWAPGDPGSWKGFSKFKSQFGTQFVRYAKSFVKIAWQRKS